MQFLPVLNLRDQLVPSPVNEIKSLRGISEELPYIEILAKIWAKLGGKVHLVL